jgi:cation:H+ antiporter
VDSFFQSPPFWLNLALFFAGAAVITKGAGWFADGAVGIAEVTGVPKMVVGATVVSLATTMPEFSVSGMAAILDRPETSFGNAVGSTICNIGLILGLAALIRPVVIPPAMARTQGLAMLAAGALLYLLGWDGVLGGWKGWLLLAAAGVFLWYQASHSGWGNGNSGPNGTLHDWGRTLRQFVIGGVGVVGGSILIVQNAGPLARAAGVPELVIALTLVALGTSLPECVTAISSSMRGHGEIAVGNVLGANVLNLTWVLGGAAAITPINILPQSYLLDFPVMALMMVACFCLTVWRGRIGRAAGGAFIFSYAAYIAVMFAWFA